MTDEQQQICEIDELPAGAGIAIQISGDRVRFQAENGWGAKSEWSGWFELGPEPIPLRWATFWVTP